jgi:quinol monooxygenase YgiN
MSKKPTQPDEAFWRLEVEIKPGKLEDFLSVARDLMDTMDEEPGTLDYEYYLSADKTVCHIHERYRDSEALITHAENFGRVFSERFMQACSPTRFNVYGAPNDTAKAVLAQYGPTYLTKFR